ncbi:MAG: hypothetical protein RLZZ408_1681 [Verrucomicrobiota bacterium]
MTPIANCKVEFTFQCPKQWENLLPTDNVDIRFCSVCRRNVYLCDTLEEVHGHAALGDCIAIAQPGVSMMMVGEPAGEPLYRYMRGELAPIF